LALENSYVCPQFNENHNLKIEGSRHPVVEKSLKSGAFISNDIELRPGGCLLLTGPNMAGKSTLMRQVALTVLLAQMGSYVPAHFANLPVYDQLFTRIGASDFLTEGLSTFMVEMKESAEMLARANVNSLVILDEVGRGTSTYDGMSLAQAILEHLVESVKSHTFFATHYHELTQLSVCYSHVVNAHMRVREKNGDIQFLHTLALGPANKSYGIQVARLAGLPQAVTQRAAKVLASLEKKRVALGHEAIEESEQLPLLLNLVDNPDESKWEDVADRAQKSQQQMELFKEIGSVSISNLTPLEALNHIDKWQRKISDSKLN
jgi:DNA mismatch repair protein MutS